MIEQPSWDDDVTAWRRYAGELRQELGASRKTAKRWKDRARAAEQVVGRVERLLRRGDPDAAMCVLDQRREHIQAHLREVRDA